MKKIIIFFVCLISLLQIPNSNKFAYSKAETTTYAKALENCLMYKSESMIENSDNVFFIIPESYFVIVLDYVNDNCYKVQYQKYIGYVSSSTVIISTFTPIVKFLEHIKFDIKETSGTQVWNKPSTSGRVLTTISAGTKGVSYIAYVYGTIPSGGESNLWYYVTFTPSENSTNVYEGYVYSENTTNLSEIVLNTECNPEVIQNESQTADGVLYISPTIKTIIVAIIAIPIILFIFIILYNLIKKLQKNTKHRKNTNNYSEEDFGGLEQVSDRVENESLKSEISKMKNTTFVKKNSKNFSSHNIPEFPDYSSDDDLL